MHRLKQSFKHSAPLGRVRELQNRVNKNAGAATGSQTQRPLKQPGEGWQQSKSAFDGIRRQGKFHRQLKECIGLSLE
jgi:hypothetical protein